MPARSRAELIALFVCLPLLVLVSLTTWRLWHHVRLLDESLVASKQTEIDLLVRVRDALGREALAGRALHQALVERDSAVSETEQALLEASAAQREANRQAAIAQRLKQQRVVELDRMQQAMSLIAETDRTPMGMVVTLSEDSFLFDFDSAALRPENREILSRIAGVLLASYGYKIFIYGHTDNQGDGVYNQGLSERRAHSVRAYLANAGVPEEILDSKGFGPSSPRAPEDSREARRKNRRVEIGIVDTVIEYRGEVARQGP